MGKIFLSYPFFLFLLKSIVSGNGDLNNFLSRLCMFYDFMKLLNLEFLTLNIFSFLNTIANALIDFLNYVLSTYDFKVLFRVL